MEPPHHRKWCGMDSVINQDRVLRQHRHDAAVRQLGTRLVLLIRLWKAKKDRIASNGNRRLLEKKRNPKIEK